MITTPIHYDEFYDQLWKECLSWENYGFEKIVFIEDIEGKLKFLIWADNNEIVNKVKEQLKNIDKNSVFFKGEIWQSKTKGTSNADKEFYESIWEEAQPIGKSEKIRYLTRVRNRGSWFQNVEPVWEVKDNPKILVFYSFKGGVGRTTSLAATALDLAKRNKKVVVVDADLDAPGIGILLPPDPRFDKPGLGIMDYLIESNNTTDYPLKDYYHEFVPKNGENIILFPSALINSNYLAKLSRLDMEPEGKDFPLKKFLEEIKSNLNPDYILIDGRAGLADSSGVLLNGFAHLYILFGTVSEQSWNGLELVIERLGNQRIKEGKKQANCILVQTMLPEVIESHKIVSERFRTRASGIYETNYYYSENDRDKGWSAADKNNPDSPHHQIPISYSVKLATFRDIKDIEKDLVQSSEYIELFHRIAGRFGEK